MKRRVAICGLGYVGTVTGACLARLGHEVVGFDVVPAKVTLVGSGVAPFVEPGLGELLSAATEANLLRATTDIEDAVQSTDVMILCVGTPTAEDETPDLRFLLSATSKIGGALRGSRKPYTVIMRSTVPPGTVEDLVIPELERTSQRLVGADGLRVLAVPEFLREACAIADFNDPAIVVVGSNGGEIDTADRELVNDLFPFPERTKFVAYRSAELLKCVCNAWHASKAVFANEIGALCTGLGINGVEVMALLCEDKKLNTSAAYLRPGAPFGGSCLPKDLRALLYLSRKVGVSSLLLEATLLSNISHIEGTISRIRSLGGRRIGLDGLAFKAGTDDLRESPMLAIAEALIEAGYDVRIHDPAVARSHLLHADKSKAHLLERFVETAQDLLRHCEVIVCRGAAAPVMQLANAMGATAHIMELGSPTVRSDAPAETREAEAAVASH